MGGVLTGGLDFLGGGDKGPDPGQLAQQQAQLNRINQFTPFGNVVFGGGRFDPNVTVTQSPEAQRLSQLLIPGAFNIAVTLAHPNCKNGVADELYHGCLLTHFYS